MVVDRALLPGAPAQQQEFELFLMLHEIARVALRIEQCPASPVLVLDRIARQQVRSARAFRITRELSREFLTQREQRGCFHIQGVQFKD